MRWYELTENPQVITSLYKEVPALEVVRVLEVNYISNIKVIRLRVNLPRFSDKPSDNWLKQGYNTIQIQFELEGVKSFEIHGWSTNNLFDINILRESVNLTTLRATSLQSNIFVISHHLVITSVSAYASSE